MLSRFIPRITKTGIRPYSHFTEPKNILTMASLTRSEITNILNKADMMKKNPADFKESMRAESLLMLFAKPSLRTRVSFEVGMTQMGGNAIYYPVDDKATLSGKESLSDFAKVVSRFSNILMARLSSRQELEQLAEYATIPVINGLDNWGHPCQILADLMTMRECSGENDLSGSKLTFIGDVHNNVTYDLMRGCAILGVDVTVCGPVSRGEGYQVPEEVISEAEGLAKQNGSKVCITESIDEAVKGADFVYADSFMSYGITAEHQAERAQAFAPFRVTESIMEKAKPTARFLHCLPADRNAEVSAEVIDGPQSVVFDEAENRLHAQKALMLYLKKGPLF